MFTGACGAIGSVVINELKKKHPNVRFVNLDLLTYAGKAENVEPSLNYRFYQGNISNAELVRHIFDTEKPRTLIHLAAETHVDNSFGNSFAFTQTNVFGTHTLLECARSYGKLERFVHMSTDEVYGSVQDGESCSEGTVLAPSNPYSATKAAAEMLCHAYMKSFKLPLIIMRCNNAVSPFQHEEKLIPRAVRCIRRGEKIPIHGRGQSKRTFVDARDIASAIDAICEKGEIGAVYNIGNDQEYTVMETVSKVLELIHPGASVEDWVEYVPDRAFQDYRYSVDSKALRKLGWNCEVSFEESIRSVIETNV